MTIHRLWLQINVTFGKFWDTRAWLDRFENYIYPVKKQILNTSRVNMIWAGKGKSEGLGDSA